MPPGWLVYDNHEYLPTTIPGLNGEDIPFGPSAGDLSKGAEKFERVVDEMLGKNIERGDLTGNQWNGGSSVIEDPFGQWSQIGQALPGTHETYGSGLEMGGTIGSLISSGEYRLPIAFSPTDGGSGTGSDNAGAVRQTISWYNMFKTGNTNSMMQQLVKIIGIDMILGGGGDTKLVTHEELVKQVAEKDAATKMPAYDPNNPTDQSIPNPNPQEEDESGAYTSGAGWTPDLSNPYSIGNLLAFAENAGLYQGGDTGEYGLGSDTGTDVGYTGLKRALADYHGGYGTSGGWNVGEAGHGGDTGGLEFWSGRTPSVNTYSSWSAFQYKEAGLPIWGY